MNDYYYSVTLACAVCIFVAVNCVQDQNECSQYASNIFVTNPRQSDGFGSQFQSIIAAVVYAELNNKQYVYTPFAKMGHNYDNDPEFIESKERFINFINNFELNKTQYNANAAIHYKLFFDQNVERCAQSCALQKIKQIFRANKNIDTVFHDTEHIHIAIHMRRPNQHDDRIDGADTPNSTFLAIIDQLRSRYRMQKPQFHLYSQGTIESFALFQAPDIMLHINESIEDTFLGMVLADVLVTGRSSFSYVAGLLSEGTVYYIPFWHTPLPHWISVKTLLKK